MGVSGLGEWGGAWWLSSLARPRRCCRGTPSPLVSCPICHVGAGAQGCRFLSLSLLPHAEKGRGIVAREAASRIKDCWYMDCSLTPIWQGQMSP